MSENDYQVFTYAARLHNQFLPSASVARWAGDKHHVFAPYIWHDRPCESADLAVAFAAIAAKNLIDAGKIPF